MSSISVSSSVTSRDGGLIAASIGAPAAGLAMAVSNENLLIPLVLGVIVPLLLVLHGSIRVVASERRSLGVWLSFVVPGVMFTTVMAYLVTRPSLVG